MTDVSEAELEFKINLRGCARCHGEGHSGLTFKKLTHPVDTVTPSLTHWASCPTTAQPILLAFVDKPDNKVP